LHITLREGDSSEVLPQILSTIDEPCLFRRNGRYSRVLTVKGEHYAPVRKEIGRICADPLALCHGILIDNVRDFTGEDDYPTLQTVEDLARPAGFPESELRDHIIRIHALAEPDGEAIHSA